MDTKNPLFEPSGEKNQPAIAPNQTVGGHYQIVRRLAAGGFGQTFVARDLHLPGQPLCVVKQLMLATSNPAVLAIAQRLFDQEAKTLYALGEHAQIPRLLAHFEDVQANGESSFYLVQSLIEGQPLSERLVPGQPWPEAEAIALTQDILQVLSFVHQNGVIHRDVKPANLLWRAADDRIILIDFGAVKSVQQASTIAAEPNAMTSGLTVTIGTPGYMPSEQQSGKPRFSSDIYAVGMVVIQAVTGLTTAHLMPDDATGEIEWRSHAPGLSTTFADLLDKMVRYDFRSRYTNATEALNALNALRALPTTVPLFAATDITTPIPLKTVLHSREPRLPALLTQRRLLLGVGLTMALSLGAAGTAFWWWATRDPFGEPIAAVQSSSDVQVATSPAPQTKESQTEAPQAAVDLAAQADERFADGDYARAIALYNQATQLGLDTTETQWTHCNQLAQQGRTETALEVCGRVSGAEEIEFHDVVIAGAHLALNGEHEHALTVLDQVERLEPGHASIRLYQAMALNGLGQYEAALEAAEAGLAQMPEISLLWVEKGNALLGLNQPNEALAAATEALALDPQLPFALDLTERIQLAL